MDSFIDNVELTTDREISVLPFDQVRKLLTSCVEPGVQSHVNGLVNVTSFAELKSALYHKYGKSLRQVQFALMEIEQGVDEPVSKLFDRVDLMCA